MRGRLKINKVILVGRLAKDPEVRYTQNGKAVATFTLAVSRIVGHGKHPETDFIPIVTWEKLAEICGNNLSKGQRALVEGRLQIRTYETPDGQKRRIAEIIAQAVEFLEKKKAEPQTDTKGTGDNINANSFGSEVFPEEEIPF